MAGPKPKTELELDALQADYLATKNPEAWKKMYEIMISYARSFALKMIKTKKFLDPDYIMGIAVDSATKIMSRYLEQDDFFIAASFGGLLKWKVLETLFDNKQKRIDSELSLNHTAGDDSEHNVELGELSEKFHLQSFSHNETYEPELALDSADDFFNVVKKTMADFDAIASYHLRVVARPFVLLFLRKSRIKNWKELFEKRYTVDFKEVKALEALVEEIQNRFCLS